MDFFKNHPKITATLCVLFCICVIVLLAYLSVSPFHTYVNNLILKKPSMPVTAPVVQSVPVITPSS